MNEGIIAILLAIVAPAEGVDATAAVEAKVLPSVEEIFSRNPNKKSDLLWHLKVVAEVF